MGGVSAIRFFAREICDMAYANKELQEFSRLLYWLLLEIVAERNLGTAVFKSAADLFKDRCFRTAVARSEYAHRSWSIAKNMCYKTWLKGDHEILLRVAQRIMAIADVEEGMFEDLNISLATQE